MRVLDRHAIMRGAVVGLILFVPLSAIRVVLDRNVTDFDNSGWAPLFAFALFIAYGAAGFAAARLVSEAPYSNAMVGAVGAFVLWIPIRIAIWALRDSGLGLVTGTDAVFTPARVLGQLVFAALFGAIGAVLAARRSTRVSPSTD